MRICPVLILALASAVPLAAAAQTGEPAPRHTLKESEPPTGSSIKRNISSGRFPYDKAYADLSDADKALLRANYEDMGPDDEPPFPLRGYKAVFKALYEIQRKLAITGVIDIGIMVDAEGKGTSVKVYRSPDPELTRIVAALMIVEQYKPALCHGQPCTQEFPFKVRFERQ
ncbi:energy transducer TonB [Massilia sp. Root418]|uniref:energy transducer TonB n=1 Tax=Massilia sp. Root418 TaxID=1736532 RepID=UPI000A7DF8A2|nr:energy transducer TonB [Massilia sp. Root418]